MTRGVVLSKSKPDFPEQAGIADRLPRHVAIIMDGNGRWAKNRLLPRELGTSAGSAPCAKSCARPVRSHSLSDTLHILNGELAPAGIGSAPSHGTLPPLLPRRCREAAQTKCARAIHRCAFRPCSRYSGDHRERRASDRQEHCAYALLCLQLRLARGIGGCGAKVGR